MYESFYNFSDKPFRLSPDSRFFFSSQCHKRALSYFLYGLRQGDGFIVITGDVGTGKSTLVSALSSALKDQSITVAKIVSTQVEAEDLLRLTAAAFGISYESNSKASLLTNLESFFYECLYQGKRALLLIDEAQNLPPRSVEELRMLSNFQTGGRSLLQTFLLGQKEFRDIMRSPEFEQLRQRVIAAYHLRPLDPTETRSYIEHRLRFVGWNQDPTFADEVFDDIHQYTNGIPRRVNVLCDRLLLFGSVEELHHIDRGVVKSVIDDLQEEERTFNSDDSLTAGLEKDGQLSASQCDRMEKRFVAIEASVEEIKRELMSIQNAMSNEQKIKTWLRK